MLSGAADTWARLWLEGEPKEADDDGRLLEEIASFLARVVDPPRRASTRERATASALVTGATLVPHARDRRTMVSAKRKKMCQSVRT